MSNISAAAVKALRERTNQPMMACKEALLQAQGDMDKAIEILRKRGQSVAVKKEDRETAEGSIALFVDAAAQVAAIVELRCETAPVAKNEVFLALAQDLAREVARTAPASLEDFLAAPWSATPAQTVKEHIQEIIGIIGENIRLARFARLTGQVSSYLHHDNSLGVLLQFEGTAPADPALLRGICMHIAAINPLALRRSDVPAEVLAKEREIARAQAEATGKPPAIIERIVESKINTWFAENVLEDQPFFKDNSKKVGALLAAAGVRPLRFIRYRVGEKPA
jgi:elongation factor Ts